MGRERIDEILSGPSQIAYDSLRMNKDAFFSLCEHFRAGGWVIDSKHIDVEQKMAIFLETIAHSVRNRIMKQKYQHSGLTISFTTPPKNRKAQQEVTGDPSQDTPKHAKQLNGKILYTYLVLCKRELDTSKDAGSGLSKASWAKNREEYNAKFNLTRGPKYFSNVWFYQKAKYSAWTWLLRRTGNGFNAETGTFHLPPEEWDALIKINENVSTFRKGGLLHEELMESIFATRVATGRYATGPARDDFIDTATSDAAADLNLEDAPQSKLISLKILLIHTSLIIILNHFKPSTPSLKQSNIRLIILDSLHLNQCNPLLIQKIVTAVGRTNEKLMALWIS
ncbi:hypothetical protein GIB67_019655 [Kingdonia uniflora]|uniref:DUF8040 domain-containing protein n=1 Tax=Kingdonia uniflora TaxID=39325 RepID=A0A7J7P4A6_9MAGN|nr:hypothetical protein GIB67_019655 [Kingdonia uniflora]